MGMYDSFYFEEGILPNNKARADHEFQTKDLDCSLDIYRIDSEGSVKKFSYTGSGIEETKDPINLEADIYSYEHENSDKHPEGYQEYRIIIVNSKLKSAEKLYESGYEEKNNDS